MIFKVGLWGASGRMGLELATLLSETFVWQSHQLELSDVVAKSSKLLSIEGVEVRDPSDPPREPLHLWIDFSAPEGTLELLEKQKEPVVIGTTGFNEKQLDKIREHAKSRAILLAPNTSLGIFTLTQLLSTTSSLKSAGFEAFVEETHHKYKKDAPSGTAVQLLQSLAQQGFSKVPTTSIRAGTVVGEHKVRFIADGEELVFEHKVTDRKVFARGALLGAIFLAHQKEPKLYTMKDVSGFYEKNTLR